MKISAFVSALCVVVLIGGCKDGHHRHRGPSEAKLQARERAAAESMQGFLDSYLDVIGGRTGLPDPGYLVPGFNLDGWDRSQYLAAFWNADEAEDAGGGDITLRFGDDSEYVVWVNSSTSPYNLALPAVVELGLLGGSESAGSPFSSYEAFWSFFMLENAAGGFSITAQAPAWEYETVLPLARPAEFTFNFIVNELLVNGKRVYETVGTANAPSFRVVKIQSVPGAKFLVDVRLLAVGEQSTAAPLVRLQTGLFYDGSPAAAAHSSLGNVAFTQNFRVGWRDEPFASGTLFLPDALRAGYYTLVVYAETATDYPDEVTGYDLVALPIEVLR